MRYVVADPAQQNARLSASADSAAALADALAAAQAIVPGAVILSYAPASGVARWNGATGALDAIGGANASAARSAMTAIQAARAADPDGDTPTPDVARMRRIEDLLLALAPLVPGVSA